MSRIQVFKTSRKVIEASAEITVDDVLEIRQSWSREVAEQWLARNEADLSNRMKDAGMEIVEEMLQKEGRHAG